MKNQRTMPGSPFGYIALRRFDGSQANVSTGTTDPSAITLIATNAKVLVDASDGKPVPINDILEITEYICKTMEKKCRAPIEAIPYLLGLLKEHTGSGSYPRAQTHVVDLLKDVLVASSRPNADIRDITGDDIGRFKANLIALGRGACTIRMYLDALGALFETGVKRGVLEDNVVRQVDKPPRPKHSPRRPFTDEELKKVFAVADDEWRGMIMVGLYTGLRIGDVSRLVFRDIDLISRYIRAAVKKVGNFEPKPIPKQLLRYFNSLEWPDDLDKPLFPRAYKFATTGCKSVSRIGDGFIALLILAGVRVLGARQGGQNRQGAEKFAPLSFHCLRHNFTSMMKKSKVSEAIARKIGGHRSVAVSDLYTHLGEDIMLDAVQGVPVIVDIAGRLAKRQAEIATPALGSSSIPEKNATKDAPQSMTMAA